MRQGQDVSVYGVQDSWFERGSSLHWGWALEPRPGAWQDDFSKVILPDYHGTTFEITVNLTW